MESLSMNVSAAAGAPLSMLSKSMDTTASAVSQLLNSGTGHMASHDDNKVGDVVKDVMKAHGIGQKVDMEV